MEFIETTNNLENFSRYWKFSDEIEGRRFSSFHFLSWNMQAANKRNSLPSKSFSSCEAILQEIQNGFQPNIQPHLISLQEIQLCKRQLFNMCNRVCGSSRDISSSDYCVYDHARRIHDSLLSNDYNGAYHRKLARSVGLYWKKEIFELHHLFFVEFKVESAISKGAVLALLEHKITKQKLLAVSVHLSAPKCVDNSWATSSQIEELTQLFLKIDEIFKTYGACPLILGGDFNCVPSEMVGCAPPLAYKQIVEKFGMRSAYRTVLGHEPILSSVNPKFPYCTDYLFYSDSSLLRPSAVLDCTLKDGQSVETAIQKLGSDPWPSDHIPLVAIFELPAVDTPPLHPSLRRGLHLSGDSIAEKVEPEREEKFTFFAVGDFGEPNQKVKIVAKSMDRVARIASPKFILSLGDNIYDDGCDSVNDIQFNTKWVDIFIRPYPSLHVPWKICLGNHDYYGSPASQIAYTTHPANPKGLWQCPSNMFRFRVNGSGEEVSDSEAALVEFFCIDTNGSQQDVRTNVDEFGEFKYPNIVKDLRMNVKLLLESLKASNARWKVVFGHHPIFTKGRGHNAEAVTLKEEFAFEEVLVRGGADVYLSGHEHVFQHHFSKGVHHFVGGATCRSHFYQGMDKNLKIDWFDNSFTAGFLTVHVTKAILTVQFINSLEHGAGSVLKEVNITKK